MKVFISWSGSRSRRVAEALRDWLPNVLQAIDPWISSGDIEKGARWSQDVAAELSKATAGILCLTPDNLEAPWLNFEAGALSRSLDKTLVCPYLIGLRPSDLKGPLVQFQAAEANEMDTRRVISTLNRALGESALAEKQLEKTFGIWWPELASSLSRIQPEKQTPQSPHRTEREILEEILGLMREQTKRDPGALTIESAKYGAGGHWLDVTATVASRVSGGRLEVYASNKLAGDPSPGAEKELVVEYTHGNQSHNRSVREGATLSLP